MTRRGCFVLYMLFSALVLLLPAVLSRPSESITWRYGLIPDGIPVVGLWYDSGDVRACIRTTFSGLYEYNPTGAPCRPIDEPPDLWTLHPWP